MDTRGVRPAERMGQVVQTAEKALALAIDGGADGSADQIPPRLERYWQKVERPR